MDYKLKDLQRLVDSMIAPLRRRVSMMIGRAVISAAVNDKTKLQSLQCDLLADETLQDLERFQQYGFTGVPMEGAESVVLFASGRDHGVVICVDDRRYRLNNLEAGEVAIYTDEGDKIHIKRGGSLEIHAATEVKVNSPKIELGESGLEALIKGETFQSFFNSHSHVGNLGIPTSPPQQPSTPDHLTTVTKGA